MRLAICTLSAVLLSGCSWLGSGGNNSGVYGSGGSYAYCGQGYGQGYGQAYGGGCGGAGFGQGQAGYGQAGYGQAGYGQGGYTAAGGYANGAGYGVDANGYASGYGIQGYQGAVGGQGFGGAYGGQGFGGAQGVGGAYGAAGAPVLLGSDAAFGSAVGGQYAGGQYVGGQYINGGVQQVVGAPIYVPQPYPSYYQSPRLRLGGAAQPLGLAGFVGAANQISGNLFNGEAAKPAGATGRSVSALEAIEYADAFDAAKVYGTALEYDISRNTTLFGGASYSQADGKTVRNGTISQTTGGVTTTEDGLYEFGDLKELTVEGGVRQYVGGLGRGLRPYVGASAGFVHNDEVHITTTSAGGTVVAAPETQTYIAEGWHPTAAGIIGAEMMAGPNVAIGVESGIRWTDDRSTNLQSEDSWSIPVSLRGRVAF